MTILNRVKRRHDKKRNGDFERSENEPWQEKRITRQAEESQDRNSESEMSNMRNDTKRRFGESEGTEYEP